MVKAIGATLGIAVYTVRDHTRRMRRELRAQNRVRLAVLCALLIERRELPDIVTP